MTSAIQTRDREMAATVEGIRQLWFADAKAFLWAHDGHLAKAGDRAGYVHDMGATLADHFGADYYPIGLVAYQVDINWPGEAMPGPCQSLAPDDSANAAEKMLHDLGRPALLVDLAFRGAATPFFAPTTSYDYMSAGGGAWTGPIQDQFSALVFLEHSAAMQPLDWASCPASPGH
jgi:erythromycin esterase-like protein